MGYSEVPTGIKPMTSQIPDGTPQAVNYGSKLNLVGATRSTSFRVQTMASEAFFSIVLIINGLNSEDPCFDNL